MARGLQPNKKAWQNGEIAAAQQLVAARSMRPTRQPEPAAVPAKPVVSAPTPGKS